MQNNSIVIECKKVKFYSAYDEDAFFECVEKIKSVIAVKGVRDSILLTCVTLTDDDLSNLVGLFRRYNIETSLIEPLVSQSQKELFDYRQEGHHINVYPAPKQ